MLWDIGAQLSFLPPTVIQIRNAHDYHEDFLDEIQFYEQAGSFVGFLQGWKSQAPHLFDRILSLAQAMQENGFWGPADVKLTQAWLEDLVALNYQPPKVVS
jgi:hypothetical protein